MSQHELWIGLVELKPLDRSEFDFAGAYTNIVTWAASPESFSSKGNLIAERLNMFVAAIDEAEPLTARTETATEEVDDLVRQARSDQNAIVFGTFDSYSFDDA
jgi:hypothetical protein